MDVPNDENIPLSPPPKDELGRRLWEIGVKSLVDFMYLDVPFRKRGNREKYH